MRTYVIILLIIGGVASLLTVIGWFPQAIKTFKTRDTSGISIGFYGLVYISTVIWLAYGILLICDPSISDITSALPGSLPLIITNFTALILNSIIIWIKINNMLKAKKLNKSEKEYIDEKYYNEKSKS